MINTIASLPAEFTGGPWAAGFGFLFFLIPLFWMGLFLLIAAFAGRRWRRAAWSEGNAPWAKGSRGAESTLAERFAQGDIEEQEYRARLEVLRANSGSERPPR
jgi:putative membrane protein